MRNTTCSACQFGNHKDHVEVVQRAPRGMMGGSRCTCKGECKGRVHPDVEMLREWARLAKEGT